MSKPGDPLTKQVEPAKAGGGGRFETAALKKLREAFRVKFIKDFLAVLFIFPLKTPSYKVKTWLKFKNSPLKLTMFF